jgi:tRNA-dihydrouridine synthase B
MPRASEYREKFHKLETLQEMVGLVHEYGAFLQAR